MDKLLQEDGFKLLQEQPEGTPVFSNPTKSIAAGNAKQGVAFDGTHVFTTDDVNLYKYTTAGSLVSSVTYVQQNNFIFEDFCIVSGVIYIPLTNYSTTPRLGAIRKYNASNLSFVEQINLVEATWPASLSHKEIGGIPYFWLTNTEESEVIQYTTSFVLVERHPLGFVHEAWKGYSGCTWIGDYFVCNRHGGVGDVLATDIYQWNGSGFDNVEEIGQITNLDQGIDYHSATETMYWCARNDGRSVWTTGVSSSGGIPSAFLIDVSRITKQVATVNGLRI